MQFQSVPELLNEMLIQYNLQKNDVIERAAFPGTYAYKIFSGEKNASRDRLLWLAFGFPLTLEETGCLLRAGGHSKLSIKNKKDVLVMYALSCGYSIQEVNKLLKENGTKRGENYYVVAIFKVKENGDLTMISVQVD